MASFSLKQTIAKGIALALPLSVVVYVVYRFIKIFEQILAPFAKRFGIENLLGEITLTFFAVFALLVIAFVLGLLMRLPFVAQGRKYVEDWIIQIIPSLNYLKLMAAEKLKLEQAVTQWKPVLFMKDDQYTPAYLIEENEEWIILATVNGQTTEPGGMIIVRKSALSYFPITMQQMKACNKHFGKGYLELIK